MSVIAPDNVISKAKLCDAILAVYDELSEAPKRVLFYPQRAKGTHRAEGASLLPTGKNIVLSLL